MAGFEDLRVYQLSYRLAMEIFRDSQSFPLAERFSLTDQIRRSSRSVAANIAEGYRKRQYPKMFVSKLADADSEVAESQVWLNFAADCGYLARARQHEMIASYREIGRMLGAMMAAPKKYL